VLDKGKLKMRVHSLKEEVITDGKTVCSTPTMKGSRIMIEDLIHKFGNLGEEEKIEFMKSVMPSFCEIFSKNPEKMMAEMMPPCEGMMNTCNMDMQGMMKMTGMMGGMGTGRRCRMQA
jgi:hypothetical protein